MHKTDLFYSSEGIRAPRRWWTGQSWKSQYILAAVETNSLTGLQPGQDISSVK